ncbi:MAG: histone deacetylase [Thermoprotei archaeon]|nr:MAG: histone deacetylase [Thermoprotei archaeon]
MVKVALIYDKRYLDYEHEATHPERRERLAYTMEFLMEEGMLDSEHVDLVKPKSATEDDLLRVHKSDYIRLLKDLDKIGGFIDYDTPFPEGLLKIILLAAGGAITAGELVMKRLYKRAFALIRPPGHHAKSYIGAGFCYVNNMAIMVEYLREKYNVRRVAILDWDAHFGDGTYEIYSQDPNVIYISIHQDPTTLYPGCGFIHEIGEGDARGTKICIPVPPGTGDKEYLLIFERIVRPIVKWFKPELIAVSAGVDCHFSDPITHLGVTAQGYGKLMQKTVDLAKDTCEGRVVVILEGGYSVEAGLPYTILAIIAALAELDISYIREPESVIKRYGWKRKDNMSEVIKIVEEVRSLLSKYIDAF